MKKHIHTKKHTSEEISLNYISTKESWDRKKIIVDNAFAYVVVLDNVMDNEDSEPKIVGAKDMILRKRMLQELNKKNCTPEESKKQKKTIEMDTPEEYI